VVSLTATPHPARQPRHKSSRRRGRTYRVLRFRFVIPMLRSRRPPEYVARGTAIGIFLAFTPTIGLHGMLVAAIWGVADRAFKWRFSPVVAFAWTWISNPLTALPIYYLLYATGQMLLGHGDDLSGYADFIQLWDKLTSGSGSFLQDLTLAGKLFLEDWGIAMAVGAVPWAVVMGGVGYWGSLAFIKRHRRQAGKRRYP
jgi:uncharacterized protein (DUF2062 family)